MNPRKILIMLLLLLVLSVGYWQFDKLSEKEAQDLATLSESLVQGVEVEDVLKIQMISPGQSFSAYRPGFEVDEQGRLLKSAEIGSTWVMSDPEGAPTIEGVIPAMLQRLFSVTVKNSVKPEAVSADQSVYGLQPPEYVLTLQGEFEKRVFSFGKKHEISGRRYVQKENDARILLIEEEDFEKILLKRDDVRSKKPLQFEVDAVNTVTILRQGSDIPLVLRKVSKTPLRWQLTAAGVEVDADAALIKKQLEKLSEIEVERFLPPTVAPLHEFGLHDPRLVLRLSFEGEENSEKDLLLQFADAAEAKVPLPNNAGMKTVGLYFFRVSFQTWIYQLATPEFRGWLQSPEHFRDTQPFSNLSLAEIPEIKIRQQERELRISRDDQDSWRLQAGEEAQQVPLAKSKFDAWFKRLTEVKVLSYPSLSRGDRKLANFDSPVFSVTVEKSNSSVPYSLIVGGALKAVNAQDDRSVDPDAPRYGLLTGEDKRQVAVVLSAALIKDLAQSSQYFLDSSAESQ